MSLVLQTDCEIARREIKVSVPHENSNPLLRELVDILLRNGIALVQPDLKEMRQLVELAELPFGEGSIGSTSDGRRILVILLPFERERRTRKAISQLCEVEGSNRDVPQSIGRRST